MKRNDNNHKKGFTLVEFIFVALALGLFMTSLLQLTIGGIRAYKKGVAQTEIKYELRRTLDLISADLRQAVPVPGTADGFISPYYGFTNTDNSLILKFERFKYNDSSPTLPKKITVTYEFPTVDSEYKTFVAGGKMYYIGALKRTEMDPAEPQNNTWEIVADNLLVKTAKVNSNKQVISGTENFKSYFRWRPTPYNPDHQVDLNVVEIALAAAKESGATVNKPELAETKTYISIRSDKGLVSGANYDSGDTHERPFINIRRYYHGSSNSADEVTGFDTSAGTFLHRWHTEGDTIMQKR